MKTIIAPAEGWKESTAYLVDVSFSERNPIHRALFFTGFLNGPDCGPGAYNKLFHTSDSNGHYELKDVRFLRVIRQVASRDDLTEYVAMLPEHAEALIAEALVSPWECPECGNINDVADKLCDKCEIPRPLPI
jgi:hypothetical protein